MNRLKAGKALTAHREALVVLQNNTDSITGKQMTAPCLDHDHVTGHCRQVLQRETNAFEGKVFNAWRRYMRHQGVSLQDALHGLCAYHDIDYTSQPLHPTFKTEDEKRIRRNKRARLARKKK